ncbi:hypothetical protein D3C72_2501330 [compost metagenome]
MKVLVLYSSTFGPHWYGVPYTCLSTTYQPPFCRRGSMVFQLGIKAVLIGCTRLPAISRSDASPEAVTRS